MILTSRIKAMGELAVQELNQISGLENDVIYHQLDIGNRESILSLRKFIEESMEKWGFKGLDILVNNAGKFFMYVTKTCENLTTYSRKPALLFLRLISWKSYPQSI